MKGLLNTARREIVRMTSRKAFLWGMIVVPLGMALFFVLLLDKGLPTQIPSGVVDLDHSEMSRQVTRLLNANELVDIVQDAESYDEALEGVRTGQTFGFFVIPANFQKEALGGGHPTLEFYSNMTYFVPGTFAFKGFKTVAVTTAGGVVKQTIQALGVPTDGTAGLLMPVSFDTHPLNNPWANYSYYLTPSFGIGVLGLMIMLMTVFSITIEVKNYTSRQWLKGAGDSILRAVTGKLLPQTVIYFIVLMGILWMMIVWRHFPMNGSIGVLLWTGLLFIIASQAFAVLVCCALPNPRLAFSVCALFGILTMSFAGFSFPVASMYGAVGVFSYLSPARYYFLIYINEALNGVPLYYSRLWIAALIVFPLLPIPLLGRLKKAVANPVYVP